MWPIFTPFWRTLTGGRSGRTGDRASVSCEADWAERLARLGLPTEMLRNIIAADALHPHFRYRRFHKPKRDGGRRAIAEPDPRLKRLQCEIVARYFATEQPHPAAVAYQRGKSTADHVWAHAGAEIVITADIRDFFPSTRADRVEMWWRERVDSETARLLTLLTTDCGGLPQGAPTSPGLSNFLNTEMDAKLTRRATAACARYTRYCDDLAFSWPAGFDPPSDFERGVRAILHEFGYELHPKKGWHMHRRGDEPEVTGAVLTRSGGVRLPERIRQIMRALARRATPADTERLKGYRGYAAMVATRPPRRG
ncbi:Reverse transcriptase (RNA-dependent DNA polymerase) [Gemmata sp. SH-PL17]|uniref:reverse transcriptase domain-containing protein n=1 Tax=Gemmata sp. SH-PL17 TaxID=1630693 RepID=UPI00078D4540|nr:reverse transcriptase domain-containing protein [Gemmata sp. SH-PL17]AMV23353.1 Reverse transcriptase (RNA-dependent DNA polymerase) [Gemmata sp. SH-PL17]